MKELKSIFIGGRVKYNLLNFLYFYIEPHYEEVVVKKRSKFLPNKTKKQIVGYDVKGCLSISYTDQYNGAERERHKIICIECCSTKEEALDRLDEITDMIDDLYM